MSSNILLIEDDENFRKNIHELLELAGYKVFSACNGMDGISLARKCAPDLILCDILMPQLDGYGVLRVMRNIPGLVGIPFIFLTAMAGSDDFRKGMDLGADDYLVKPVTGAELYSVIDKRLQKSKIQQAGSAPKLLNGFFHDSKILPGIASFSGMYKIKKIKKKSFIFMEGDSIHFLYYLYMGKVKTFKTTDHGKELLTEISNAGDFFGYSAISEKLYKESALAMEDSEIALIPQQNFFNVLHSCSEVSVKFLRLLSNNLFDAEDKMVKLAYNSARKRVADALVFLCRKYNAAGNENVPFPAQRENISGIAGIAPESVSRNLGCFKTEGLIEIGFRTIKIIDFKKMEDIKN